MNDVFEGTSVKRYALRCKAAYFAPWQYPPTLEYDTPEAAAAARKALGTLGQYQIVEKLPHVQYKPYAVGEPEPTLSALLLNVLKKLSLKPYRLQWSNGRGWQDCPELQFDALADAQAASYSGREGFYRVMMATLKFRYEPLEVSE